KCADKFYNEASVKGDTKSQTTLLSTRQLAELLFFPVVYEKMLRLLLQLNPTRVICVEPIGVMPMVRAIRKYNSIQERRQKKSDMKDRSEKDRLSFPQIPEFEFWMTDMPTVFTQHTFQMLRVMTSA